MSDNNQNKGSKQKDSFAKPGDENIVSGKSFFLSFGKQKKGPSNPLLESEKNKNNSKNDSRDNGAKNDRKSGEQQKNVNNNGEAKSGVSDGNKDRNNFKKKNHRHNDKKQNSNIPKEKNASPETKPEMREEKRNAPEREEHRDNHRNQNQKHGNHRNRNNGGNGKEKENVNNNNTNTGNGGNGNGNQQNRQNNRKNDRNDKIDRNNAKSGGEHTKEKNVKPVQENVHEEKSSRFGQGKRPKHKKEKFVPSVPEEEIKSEELLQPIVDKSGIVSAPSGMGLRHQRSSFASNSSMPLSDGEEPRYIDRNRPLAEQIAEQSKPKTYKHHITENTETVEVIGVRFREAGKVYYFDPDGHKIEKGQPVIVETARGVEYGFCAIANRYVSTDNIVPPLKKILRAATDDDTERYESNKQLEAGAAKVFREKVRALGLEMSLVYVEYTFDNGKLLFYFTADGRVDFRELIKELAASFRTRIELRQIGVRDEAKIVGGLGICGRPVCCKSFLGEFSQVSIKMAKDQNLFINSSKISGTCGRFMCCIRYEDEVYQKEYERTPKVDAIVETPEGKGVVVESNALKGVVKVLLDEKPEELPKPYKCTEVKLLGYIKRENENDVPEGMDIPEEGSGS